MLANHTLAWLLTYLLHSTLLLGLARLASKPLGRWSVAAEEAVWKVALVGALFTASLQLATGWEPMAGRWNVSPAAQVEAALPASPVEASTAPAWNSGRAFLAPEPVRSPAVERTPLPLPSIPVLALGAWALVGCLLLAGYGRSHLRLRRRLLNRPRVVGGTLLSRLRSLTAQAGFGEDVQLSCSSRVPVPLALGLSHSEICLPPRALAGLSDEQQEGMLAHELAHLVRRDPLWLIISHVLTCLFFFQPLNWVARRRLREISELLSDEWAVGRTGRPLSLAGCLAEVAGWSTARRELPVPGMADRQSHLAQRIRRLLDASRSPESPARRIWLGVAMVVLLIAVVAAAPAISAARQEASSHPEAPVPPAGAPAAAVASDDQEQAQESDDHEVSEEQVAARHDVDSDVDEDKDDDHDYDSDYDSDSDHDYEHDFDFDADEIADQVGESVEAALGNLDGQLESLSEMRMLSDQEQEKLEQDIERANQEIERTLKPRIDQLSRELSEKISRQMPTAEMRKLEAEMETLAEQMRPSPEEMARLQAQVDEEVRKLQADGDVSREERRKLAEEARRMAREMRPSEEQRKAMEDLRRQHRELSQKFMAGHREEIEKATREMREASQQMREEIQREMDAVRQEVHRSMEQRRLRLQEERKERQRQHEEMRKDKDPEREEGEAKPPKLSLLFNPREESDAKPSKLSLLFNPLAQLLAEPDPGC